MKIITERKRRSEALSNEEFKSLKKFVSAFPTVVDAAIAFDLPRQTLERVVLIGSGSTETINKIRKKINVAQRA